ncbi:histidine kinase [Pedobacter sp. MC2016-14]|uniref:sensor histidine kinase n=1 Tax=Pedobacter sp. MC2016-14 TaxID=2897327 RepID=UPI001E3709DA|nr:histidine kinase [Pedobacter sp. MC2016-14]MCD0490084.1 histidine kinase [Pedobacter sp. MC2016-14]
MDNNERRICLYSSLLIALVVNSGRLLALRPNSIMARYWQFDFGELSFQLLFNLAFCCLIFYLNLAEGTFLMKYRKRKQLGLYVAANGLVVVTCMVIGNAFQHLLFAGNHIGGSYKMGYFVRFGLSSVLIFIILRIILLLRAARAKNVIHEQLKHAYLQAQLELLKQQLNPHLLFNSLSSLSGIVREDPKLAQFYILHLSKVFRHALSHSGSNLVTLDKELDTIKSYAQLLNMRFEQAFCLEIDVPQPYLQAQIPHLSIQPLLENAAKHNSATLASPLIVRIYIDEQMLIVSNNLQELTGLEDSHGIGLLNLTERFRLLVEKDIEIEKTDNFFKVKLPLTL